MSEEIKKYIKKYFRLEFLVCYDSIENDELDKIVTGIGRMVSKKYKTKDVSLGKADHLIHRMIDESLKKSMPNRYSSNLNLKRYVKNYIRNNFFVNYSDKTLDYITERIALKIGTLADYRKLMNGDSKVDSQILEYYGVIYRDTLNRVYKYAKDYLIRKVYPMLDIDEVEVANDLVIKIMNDDKYNVIDLFTKKYDVMIEQMAYANRKKNEQNKPDPLKYILVYIVEKLDDYLDHDELVGLSMAVEATLRERGHNTKDIVEHKCDEQIRRMYNAYMMKKNSVYEEEKPKRIKHKPNMKKIQKNVATILILATLTSAAGATLYTMGKGVYDGANDLVADFRYNSVSSQLSNNKYEYVFTKYTDGYLVNMDFVVEDYNNYSKLGDVYGYLGFYEVYKHTQSDTLAIMDSFLDELSYKIFQDKYDTDMKISSTYFIQFAYDRLVEMGCEEIQKEKYVNAIEEYKRVSLNNNDKSKTTMDCIEENDKKNAKIIYDIMDMYHQYSAKYYKELSEIYVPNGTKGRL